MCKKIFGYVRVSTVGQADNGCSLPLQKTKIKSFCELHDLELVRIYEDAGRSAKDIKGRPAFSDCLEALYAGKANGLCVYKLDRGFRSTTDCLTTVENLQKKGLMFISVTENLSTDGAIGVLFVSILASLSTFERMLISERTSQALQGKIARNERTGSIPYGWRVLSDGIHLEECPDEQKIINRIRWYGSRGYSFNRIAKVLNEHGYRTKHGKEWRERQVARLLQRHAA